MRNHDERDGPDPAEAQPTDNSSGVPIDLDRLEEAQQDLPEEER